MCDGLQEGYVGATAAFGVQELKDRLNEQYSDLAPILPWIPILQELLQLIRTDRPCIKGNLSLPCL